MVEKENDIVAAAAAPAVLAKTENNISAVADAATNPAATPPNKSDLKVLAFHFFEAYYTKLSDHPDDIGTFYGEDSIFAQDDVEEIGRENIQNAIAAMNFGGCKSRFYSLKATPAIGDSKVFQVCGELTLKGQPAPRRFSQTIVLSCAPPNVLYVKSNIFQWLDVIFPMNGTDNFISPPYSGQPVENGNGGPPAAMAPMKAEKPLLNGGNHVGVGQSPATLTPSKNEPTVVISGGPPPGLEKMAAPPQPIAQMAAKTTPEKAQPALNNGIAAVVENSTAVDAVGADENNVEEPPKSRARTLEQQGGKEEEERNKDIAKDNKVEDDKKEHPAAAPETEHPQKHQPKSVEPKSWNKVVSGGQNKFQPQQQDKTMASQQHQQTGGGAPLANVAQQPIKKTHPPPHSNEHPQNHQQSKENTPTPPPHQNAGQGLPAKQHHNQNQQRQFHSSSPSDEHSQQQQLFVPAAIVKPRADWPYRIYFNNLDKPVDYVNNKIGQQELKKEIMAITQGVEFVAIKPNSLRSNYQFAFGFIDFTSAEDMQAVYDAAQKDGDKNRLKVSIPHFQFNGYLALTSEKTNNLGAQLGGGNTYGQGNFHGRQQNFHPRSGAGQSNNNNNNNAGGPRNNNKTMAPPTKQPST